MTAPRGVDRRRLLGGAATGLWAMAAGAQAGCAQGGTRVAALPPDGPLERTTITLPRVLSLCVGATYAAEDFLRAEGFTEVRYAQLKTAGTSIRTLADWPGEVDIGFHFASILATAIDQGVPITVLAGAHIGCFELFGNDGVRSVRDLKGKTVAVPELGSAAHVFLSSMLANVGLDPARDVTFITEPSATSMQLLADRGIDAFLGFPPEPQILRSRGIRSVIVNSMTDRPWSQYFCCLVAAHTEFARKYPVATMRALRALLRAADLVARDPEHVAHMLVDRGYTTASRDHTAQAMRDLPYDKWREYDPADTLRFYALRLKEVGMVKNTPEKILSTGTDWRFLNALKKEAPLRTGFAPAGGAAPTLWCPLDGPETGVEL